MQQQAFFEASRHEVVHRSNACATGKKTGQVELTGREARGRRTREFGIEGTNWATSARPGD